MQRHAVKSDLQLKKDVTAELEWDPSIDATQVGVSVKDGVVTLSGHLDTYVQKYAVERAAQRVRGVRGIAVELDPGHHRSDADKVVRCLTGVVGVSNAITLKPVATQKNVSDRIREALTRHANDEARHIEVVVKDDKVILRGRVDSMAERAAASTAAWSAPRVSTVVNALEVDA